MARGKMHRAFWWGNLNEEPHFGDKCIDGRIE